jgi:hypothetical protein
MRSLVSEDLAPTCFGEGRPLPGQLARRRSGPFFSSEREAKVDEHLDETLGKPLVSEGASDQGSGIQGMFVSLSEWSGSPLFG